MLEAAFCAVTATVVAHQCSAVNSFYNWEYYLSSSVWVLAGNSMPPLTWLGQQFDIGGPLALSC
jgi:hypothetical protein